MKIMLLSQKIREVHFEKDHSSCKKKRVHYKIIMKQVWADKKVFEQNLTLKAIVSLH